MIKDIFFFDHDKTTDVLLYKKLYGPHITIVLDKSNNNNDNYLLAVFNAYANLVICNYIFGPELKKTFQNFLIMVEKRS